MLLHSDMGFPEKDRPEPTRWPVSSGFSPPRTPLRSRNAGPSESGGGGGEKEEEECSTAVTPTAKEARIPEQLRCPPPPPRKSMPSVRTCQRSSRVEFFSCPPDLEAVFMRRPPEEAK